MLLRYVPRSSKLQEVASTKIGNSSGVVSASAVANTLAGVMRCAIVARISVNRLLI